MTNFENLIRNTKTLDLKELKEESEKLFNARQAREENLVAAYNNKLLKSKNLIKEAREIINSRNSVKKDN